MKSKLAFANTSEIQNLHIAGRTSRPAGHQACQAEISFAISCFLLFNAAKGHIIFFMCILSFYAFLKLLLCLCVLTRLLLLGLVLMHIFLLVATDRYSRNTELLP